jgi:DUF1009 family protein
MGKIMSDKTIPLKKKEDAANSREVVRRNELTPIITQIINNVNEMAHHLMNDVNNLFKRFVYPLMMRTNAIENLLIKSGVMTKEEINEEQQKITREAVAKAKEINEEGKVKEQPSNVSGDGIQATETMEIEKIHHEDTPEKIDVVIDMPSITKEVKI